MSIREDMQSLVAEIVSATEARRSSLLSLRQQVVAQQEEARGYVQTACSGRLSSAHQMRSALNKEHLELAQGKSQRSTEFWAWLDGVAGARQDMAQQQHTVLTSGRSGLAQAEAQRGSRVQGWLREISDARRAAQIEWRHLAATRCPVSVGFSKAGKATEEVSRLRERVFEGLADHPDGLRLTEIEREFGMSRFESNRVVKGLIDSGKAEKRGLLYFAI